MKPPPIDSAASVGFEAGAEGYDQGRAEYPAQAIDRLCEALALTPSSTVLDLGAGTGKLTRLICPRVGQVIAVEPVRAMRQILERNVPQAQILEGSAAAVPCASGSVDAVIVAQAFHWFANEASLCEIHRVLRAPGHLGLVWNRRDEADDLVAQFVKLISRYQGNTPQYRDMKWTACLQQAHNFGPLESWSTRHRVSMNERALIDHLRSVSFVAAQGPQEQAQLVQQVEALVRVHPRTRDQARFDFPYLTDVYWCAAR